MHDPSTVAFDIKSPFRGAPSKMWPSGYRKTLVTIWHEDPLNFKDKCGCRDDDSCGWFRPPYSKAEGERVKRLSLEQYRQIFNRQVAEAEGASYVNVCTNLDCHAAVYWSWRALRQAFKPRGRWQYGRDLSLKELTAIYDLATCPIDNMIFTHSRIKDAESFQQFFFCIYGAFRRFHRPWYRHPRWHVHHWRLQIHAWQTFRRWAFSRCAGCGQRFTWGYSPTGFCWDKPRPKWFCSEVDAYHSECANAHLVSARGATA